ncbi:MAG: ABC transporter ATP-binding protein [archaeon GB-1867-035]|nr:ABC transporter ATP-binding protein [Candidatus Culexmicrobium profundum]
MNEIIIELVDVKKIYTLTKEIQVHALRGVDLQVSRGELLIIMGPSGSGKTTLLQIIGTLDKPTSGRVIIDGIDVTDFNENQLARLRREKIGFVFQFFNLIPTLTAIENVMFPMLLAGKYTKEEALKRAQLLLTVVGLEKERWMNTPRKLSGGQQQKVAIARALANNPKYVLMDEPTGNLDVYSSAKVLDTVKWLNQFYGQTFIVVTHNPEVAEMGSRLIYIRDGRIMGSPKTLIRLDTLQLSKEEIKMRLEAQLDLLKIELSSAKRRNAESKIIDEIEEKISRTEEKLRGL